MWLVYTAPTVAAAATELDGFADSVWGHKYPAAVKVWRDAWDRFIPFLEFPPALRKIIYTTNAIESLNYQLRKIIKNRGHFPNDDAVIKLLWLAIPTSRTNAPANAPKKPANPRTCPAKPHPDSSKAPKSNTGTKPSAPSPSPSPAASTPPSDKPNQPRSTTSLTQQS